MGSQSSCCNSKTVSGITCYKDFQQLVPKAEAAPHEAGLEDPSGTSADALPFSPHPGACGEADPDAQALICEESYGDGSTYKGSVVDGKRHGHGVWVSDKGQYDGQWLDDHRHGQGQQSWEDGRVYTGQFRAGKFHGDGHMVWRTDLGIMSYVGQYLEDAKHGQGKYTWPDNRVYDGGWQHGKRSGTATYTAATGESRRGIWVDDAVAQWLGDAQPATPQP